LLLLPAYRYNSDANKNYLIGAVSFSSTGFAKEERELVLSCCFSYQRTDTTRVLTRTILCVLHKIQFEEVVVEKGDRELVLFLLLLPAYRYNSDTNKDNLIGAVSSSTTGFEKEEKELVLFSCFSCQRTDITRIESRTIFSVLRNSSVILIVVGMLRVKQ
jgi:hypothetical protein